MGWAKIELSHSMHLKTHVHQKEDGKMWLLSICTELTKASGKFSLKFFCEEFFGFKAWLGGYAVLLVLKALIEEI